MRLPQYIARPHLQTLFVVLIFSSITIILAILLNSYLQTSLNNEINTMIHEETVEVTLPISNSNEMTPGSEEIEHASIELTQGEQKQEDRIKTAVIEPQPQKQIPCPDDAQLCWDGSSVTRTGPHCDFPECPPEQFTIPYCNSADEDSNFIQAESYMSDLPISVSVYISRESHKSTGPCNDGNIMWSEFDVFYKHFDSPAGSILVNSDTAEVTFTPIPSSDTPEIITLRELNAETVFVLGESATFTVALVTEQAGRGNILRLEWVKDDGSTTHWYTLSEPLGFGIGIHEIEIPVRNVEAGQYRVRLHLAYSIPALLVDTASLFIPLGQYTSDTVSVTGLANE